MTPVFSCSRLGGSIRVRSRGCSRTVDTAADENNQAKMTLTNGREENCIASFVCKECQLLLGEIDCETKPNLKSYNLCRRSGSRWW